MLRSGNQYRNLITQSLLSCLLSNIERRYSKMLQAIQSIVLPEISNEHSTRIKIMLRKNWKLGEFIKLNKWKFWESPNFYRQFSALGLSQFSLKIRWSSICFFYHGILFIEFSILVSSSCARVWLRYSLIWLQHINLVPCVTCWGRSIKFNMKSAEWRCYS